MMNKKPPHLPSLPGIYIFKNTLHEIIYVGKAKSLKKRVQSYFAKYGKDWKIDALLEEYAVIEHIITNSEEEALLLEAQMIKEHQPKYNVLLKSGQPFLYLLFTQEKLPKLKIVRNKKQKGTYFGPFLQKIHARRVYTYLFKTFQLTWCTKKIQGGCLQYHLELCAGNCKNDFDADAYLFRINLAMNALKNRYRQSLKDLQEKIKEYNAKLEFEKAQHLAEYEQNLEAIFKTLRAKFTETKYEKEIFLATTPMWRKTKKDPTLGEKIQAACTLNKAPATIDCFDISHFQSSFIVGSCIRFTHGVPDKNCFRRFKIRTIQQQNDYAALQEVVKRRYRNENELPDLILIDGGKGQLNAIKDLFPQTQCISLAKREERVFRPGDSIGNKLDPSSEAGKLLIALRDYAHHFALSYHRYQRRKKTY